MAIIENLFTPVYTSSAPNAATYNAGSNYTVVTPTGVIYSIVIGPGTDPGFYKSTDRGVTWGSFTALKACTGTNIAVWADWWSGITATAYIHVVYTDSGTDDTFYRYIDTANSDTLGTERTVYAGSSTAAGGFLSITRARGGNLICATCIDAGAEYDTVRSTDLFVNKTSISEVWEGATSDKAILFPNPDSADNQDVMAIFIDDSAVEASLKKYDDSGDSWSEASIVGTLGSTVWYDIGSLAYDAANSQYVMLIWNGLDAANADLLCYTLKDAGATAKTDVVTNSTDDQGRAILCIIGSRWTAIYKGLSDGSETYSTELNYYYKVSTDGGTNWGSETLFKNDYNGLIPLSPMMLFDRIYFASTYKYGASDFLFINIPTPPMPRASYQLGM